MINDNFRSLMKNHYIIAGLLNFLCGLILLLIITACNKAPDCSKETLDKARESFDINVIQRCADIGNEDVMVQLGIYYELGRSFALSKIACQPIAI